jgi:hypothetical protein
MEIKHQDYVLIGFMSFILCSAPICRSHPQKQTEYWMTASSQHILGIEVIKSEKIFKTLVVRRHKVIYQHVLEIS